MSIIVHIDNEFHVLDSSVLLRGSVEAVGETVNINFYGVTRTAVYCEAGIPKRLNKEVEKWKDGVKTFDNQKKKETKKKVLLPNGKTVEVIERPKRQRVTASPQPIPMKKVKVEKGKKRGSVTAAVLTADVRLDQCVDTVDGADPTLGGNRTAVGGYMSRKEKRAMERATRESMTPVLDEEDDDEEMMVARRDDDGTVAQPSTRTSGDVSAVLLAAVQSMKDAMSEGLLSINKNLEQMNRRINRLEDQQDEIADTLESQRTLIREVASTTPMIAANAHKAAEGTDKISEMLPPAPPIFTYRFVSEPRVRQLDEENDDFLSFCSALDREMFSEVERRKSLAQRDKIKVKWLTECVIYRRRFSVGGGRKMWAAAMRKRLNTYASKKRVGRNEDVEATTEDQVEGEEEEEREEEDVGEGEGQGSGQAQIEGDVNEEMDGRERMGGRLAGGSEIQGVFDYLEDENFD